MSRASAGEGSVHSLSMTHSGRVSLVRLCPAGRGIVVGHGCPVGVAGRVRRGVVGRWCGGLRPYRAVWWNPTGYTVRRFVQ